jgi:hypothetical protein
VLDKIPAPPILPFYPSNIADTKGMFFLRKCAQLGMVIRVVKQLNDANFKF